MMTGQVSFGDGVGVKLFLIFGSVVQFPVTSIILCDLTGSKQHIIQAVELSQRSQTAVQIVSFLGLAGNADPLDGWLCSSQKRVMSRLMQVRQH